MDNENITKEENLNELPGKVVRSAPIARELVRQGCRIIDLKPRKDNRREFVDENGVKTVVIDNSSVYVFEKTIDMLEAFDRAKSRRRRLKGERRNETNEEVDEGLLMEE